MLLSAAVVDSHASIWKLSFTGWWLAGQGDRPDEATFLIDSTSRFAEKTTIRRDTARNVAVRTANLLNLFRKDQGG
jgi:hypothetical protein